ncbi:MAG: glycosyltransferase [Elusimicrobia bacterium]|nr:glycosyltransferase [Elusimicrobiota bacterium]
MRYFVYYYLYDERIKDVPGGPMKVFDLCSNLKALGHDVVLFAPDIGGPREQTTARVVLIPAFGVPLLGIIWHEAAVMFASLLELARGGCGAVYARITTSFAPLAVARLAGARLLTEVNDDPFLRYAAGAGKLKTRIVRFCDGINLRRSDRVLAVNAFIKKALEDRLGVDPGRVRVVPSGANTALFRPYGKEEACRELSLDPSLRYICFVGSLNPWNDYALIVSAAAGLCAERPDLRCVLAGDLDARVERLIASSGMRDKFVLTGRVAPAAAVKYIACSEVCLSAISPDSEPMTPVKIFDYLSCARPVVAAGPRGEERLLEGCGAAVLTPAGDAAAFAAAVRNFLADPSLALRAGAGGRKYVMDHYDRVSIARNIAALAEEAA